MVGKLTVEGELGTSGGSSMSWLWHSVASSGWHLAWRKESSGGLGWRSNRLWPYGG